MERDRGQAKTVASALRSAGSLRNSTTQRMAGGRAEPGPGATYTEVHRV